MMKRRFLVLSVAAAFVSECAHHSSDTAVIPKECFQEASFKYCLFPSPNRTNASVAYFFHGRGGSERDWESGSVLGREIKAFWKDNRIEPPTIVSVSFGKAWLLSPRMASPESGLLELFERQVIPNVESRMTTIRKRIVFGASMGGLNALIVGLSSKLQFDKVGALCAGIYDIPLFQRPPNFSAFVDQTGADPKYLDDFASLAARYVSTSGEWARISPLALLDSSRSKGKQKIYLWAGKKDRHGNFAGAASFADRAKKKGLDVEWISSAGGHCTALDIPSIAKFLAD
jgi:hypothetical protein